MCTVRNRIATPYHLVSIVDANQYFAENNPYRNNQADPRLNERTRAEGIDNSPAHLQLEKAHRYIPIHIHLLPYSTPTE